MPLPEGFSSHDFMSRYRRESHGPSKIRLLALHHLQQGKSTQEVSCMLGYPRQTVWEWLQWFKNGGLERICSKPVGRGRKSKLTDSQQQQLYEAVPELQAQLKGGRLKADDIRIWLEKKWGVKYAPGSIYPVLRRLKLVWITSRSRHPLANKEAQADFKKSVPAKGD